MAGEVVIGMDQVLSHFEDLEDPRSDVNLRHPLVSVVVIALMAALAGAEGPTAVAEWAKLKEDLLRQWLPLPNGIPRKDVYRRVLSALKPEAFQACFFDWLQSLRTRAAQAGGGKQPVFPVDGKTLRRSHDGKKGLGALHSVSLWAADFGLTLAQVATDEKSNEITAIPELLKLVDISGAIITIDAMGTQKAIAEQIVDADADYVLALKGNQGSLYESVVEYFDEQFENNFADVAARRLVTHEKGHGREETRTYIQLPVPEHLPGRQLWRGLKTIGVVLSLCQRDGQETSEIRYYISSLPLGVKNFARAVRGHWSIENSCHWSLDVTYREDQSRIRDEHARQNFAWINRFTLSLLKQHSGNGSVAMKRRKCGWNDDVLLQVLTGKET